MSVLESSINCLTQPERETYDETCQAIIKLEDSLKKNVEDLSLIEAQRKLIGPHVDFLKKRLKGLYEQRARLEIKALNINNNFNSASANSFNAASANAAPCQSTASAG